MEYTKAWRRRMEINKDKSKMMKIGFIHDFHIVIWRKK